MKSNEGSGTAAGNKEKSRWESIKESAKHTGSEYLKHKALDLAVEHGVKPAAKRIGSELLGVAVSPFIDYMMNYGE